MSRNNHPKFARFISMRIHCHVAPSTKDHSGRSAINHDYLNAESANALLHDFARKCAKKIFELRDERGECEPVRVHTYMDEQHRLLVEVLTKCHDEGVFLSSLIWWRNTGVSLTKAREIVEKALKHELTATKDN